MKWASAPLMRSAPSVTPTSKPKSRTYDSLAARCTSVNGCSTQTHQPREGTAATVAIIRSAIAGAAPSRETA